MFIDMTIGLLILYGLISLSRYLLRDSSYPHLKSGEYGNPPQVGQVVTVQIFISIVHRRAIHNVIMPII